MKEARLILPNDGNNGESLAPVHRNLKRQLIADFGGYTAMPCNGGWLAPDGEIFEEPGTAYDIAVPAGAFEADRLRAIARQLATDARQQAIYLRHADGYVEFVEPVAQPAVAA